MKLRGLVAVVFASAVAVLAVAQDASTRSTLPAEKAEASCDRELAQRTFQQCKVCHSTDKGAPHQTGPNLHGVYGQVAGTAEGFRFSPVLRKAEFVWNDETLDAFLANPQGKLPANRMAFGGVTNSEARSALICLLRDLK